MKKSPRICLIVDNPLRDLDGVALLAWQLARQGAECFLVPMYTQGFDVPALQPDVVVANYVRRNNLDLLKQYKRAGMRVAVLDTEGAISRSAELYAHMVGMSGCKDFVDLYCVWGDEQRDAFIAQGVMPAERVRVTGCPRYDFCAPKWRPALAPSGESPGFVLINTNFPVVNPRFSSGTKGELKIWKRVGVDADWAAQFATDSRQAFESMLAICDRLANDFPGVQFVLRPHPFEDLAAYQTLEQRPNFKVRQSGTVLGWLHDACLLLHQNCSTAVEAVMLDKSPVSLEWFNTPALAMPSPTRVSCLAANYGDLRTCVLRATTGQAPETTAECVEARQSILHGQYAGADGDSAARTAAYLLALCDDTPVPSQRGDGPSIRGRVVAAVRKGLGFKRFQQVRSVLYSGAAEYYAAKAFTAQQVGDAFARIAAASRITGVVRAEALTSTDLQQSIRRGSGAVVRVSALPGTLQ